MNLIHILFYEPIFNLLIILYNFTGNLGIAILVIALLSRILTYPFTKKQIKSAEKNQEFQAKVNAIKKKYKNNQEKMAQEMAKVQAEYLPGQLGGCLNIIITIVLLLQVRNVIINLVNKGVHAFNEVSYSQDLEIPEDSVAFELDPEITEGTHTLKYEIEADNGNKLTKEVIFAIDREGGESMEELDNKVKEVLKSDDYKNGLVHEREANIGLFVEQLEDSNVIEIGTEKEIIKAYLRPPSNHTINYDETGVVVDDVQIEQDKLMVTKGETFNFNFLGADLARVASDFDFANIAQVFPYVLIAVLVGITQFFSSKIQMGMRPEPKATGNTKEKKKSTKDPEDLDFAEIMQESSKQMTYVFPLLTIALSLGFMGGATFFPTGVSVFWTGQNTFVIIQQALMNKEKLLAKIKSFTSKV